ncbi:predicted protein [Nematostella vectensis]|uniref:Active breakpoint cluster region-related protein n=1 Tax=Nematostella vectensis TaxID=45351 RepID=A7RM51_NEMVE|nr:predicted protein [Nematostella vectensis]|eukprot:XP_001639504.1 predicted protein [Nematostella vectensis]
MVVGGGGIVVGGGGMVVGGVGMVSADNLDDSAQKLHARKWVASAVMDSEKGYLLCLSTLHKYMKPFKASLSTSAPILTVADFNKIFYKIDELFTIHSKFYNDLEARVASWNPNKIIGDLFLSLVEQFDVYREYIMNYKTAIDTIHKCKSNEQFSQIFSKEIKLTAIQEVTTLEGLFSKPVDRIGRYVTVLNDLMKQTPQDHPDHSILTDVQVYTLQFISRISGGDQKDGPHFPRVKRDHHLIKDGFLVELTDGVRKFRHLFLFNDVLICTKRKISGRQEQYVSKWYLQLSDVQLHPHENSEAAQIVPVASQADFDLLKGRIVSLKAEIKQEQGMTGQSDNSPDASPSSKQKRAHSTINKMVEKLKKKLAQQEAALLLAIPSLPLHLYHRQGKTYTLLCKSDVERADWKEAMLPLLKQDNLPSGALSLFELQTLLEACKKLRTCKTIGKVSIKEDKELFNGVLYVHVQNGKGFHRSDLYCTLEVDHFGQFVKKARTKIAKTTGDPVWDQGTGGETLDTCPFINMSQDFDLEVEGTKELRIHVYSKSRYTLQRDEECGLGRIQLRRESLADLKKRTITIALDKQGAITLSLQYSKTRQGIERKKSVNSVGVFGVDIETVTSRESCDIPLIVIGCVREIEKRGLEEVGIYRLSGASSDVKRLKEGFDENSQSALVLVSEADIHAVAGLFKMYLRDLPEPLFTDELYDKFVKAYAMADAEEKRETMLELFQSLPTPNRLTACYLFQHLRKVAEKSEVHKMGLNNLSTVFGPNVLRPSPKTSSPMDLAQGTLDVMSQVGIFMYFLKLDAEELHLPNDPELMRRLDPCHGSDVTTGEPELFQRSNAMFRTIREISQKYDNIIVVFKIEQFL